MLHSFTTWVNFIALMLALWLGLYLITRNARRPEAWLAALALWSTSAVFLNELLALYPPPIPSIEMQGWVYHLILFWPRNVFVLGWRRWLQGWLPAYGIAFWYHATLYLRPGGFNKSRQVGALLGYIVVLTGILLKAHYLAAWINPLGSPLYSSPLPFSFNLLGGVSFLVFAGLSLVNMSQGTYAPSGSMTHQQFHLFLIATLLASSSGLPGFASYLLGQPIPQVLAALPLFLALLMGGIGFAHYFASLDQLPLKQDLLFSAAEITSVLAIYLLFEQVFNLFYRLPLISFVFTGCLAVITHLIIDVTRLHFNPIFPLDNRSLKSFRQPGHLPKRRVTSHALELALETLIDLTGATWVVVLRFTQQGMQLAAAWNWQGAPLEEVFAGNSMSVLHPSGPMVLNQQLPPPLDQAAVMLPLYQQERKQAGILLVGASRRQAGFSQSELDALQDSRNLIASLVAQPAERKEDRIPTADTVPSNNQDPVPQIQEISPRMVELGLRNLHDYAYLADSPLADLRLVVDCSEGQGNGMDTFIIRGKAVSNLLAKAVLKLKPEQEKPAGAPPRSWYPYLILRNAYLEGVSNREIMSQLYISEGTFNRTRRAAIQSVARILEEMEASLNSTN